MDSSFRTLCTLKYKYICSTIYYNIQYILYLLTPTLKYNWPKLLLISGLSLYASAWIFSSRSQTRKYSCYGTRCCQNCRFRIGSRNSFFATLYRLCFYKMVSFVYILKYCSQGIVQKQGKERMKNFFLKFPHFYLANKKFQKKTQWENSKYISYFSRSRERNLKKNPVGIYLIFFMPHSILTLIENCRHTKYLIFFCLKT